MEFVATDSLVLHVRRQGNGGDVPLVFINSLGSDLRIWEGVVKRLPDRTLVRYDKRGHGLSDCPPGPYSVRDHAEDLRSLLDALAIEEAILVGISVGGMIALDFASRHSERTRGLVVCDSGPKIATSEFWEARVASIREQGMEAAAEGIVARWFSAGFAEDRPADLRGYYNMLSRTPEEGYTSTCAAIGRADLRGILGQIDLPSLVLCGSEDVSTPPEMSLELSRALPKARFELIEGAGHLPCVERPEHLAATIGEFVRENGYG